MERAKKSPIFMEAFNFIKSKTMNLERGQT